MIPTYQETDRLFRAVASAKAQTHQINKIFVVDDGSSDVVRNAINRRFLGDPQIEVIQNHHTGLPGAGRKIGVELSRADWIAFLDADDTWLEEKTFTQLRLARTSGADLVFSNAQVLSDGEHLGAFFSMQRFQANPSFRQLIADNRIVNSSVLVRRPVLSAVGVYADSAHVRGVEDYATWLRICVNHNLVGIDKELVQFEVSKNGIGLSSNPMVRIFALADFIAWSRGPEAPNSPRLRKARRAAIGQIVRENK